MEASNEHDSLAQHLEEESVREPANAGAARLAMKNRKCLGPFEDCLDAGENLG